PVLPQPRQHDPEDPVRRRQLWARLAHLPRGDLLSECEVLQRQLPLRANRGPQCPNEDRKPSHHIRSIADQSRQPQDNRDGRVLRKDRLRKALGDVFGDAAVIQRCQLHKARNLDALIPQPRQAYVRTSLRRAYRAPSAAAARRQLTALATWLERNGHADAAASMREGREETPAVLKLGLPPTLRRFFATTNCIENLIGTVRHVTRNIKRWRNGDM